MNLCFYRVAAAGLSLAVASQDVFACATCGCTLSADAAMGYASDPGWRLNLEYDYLHQDQLRDGTHAVSSVPDGTELERDTLNRYVTADLNYRPNADWNIDLKVPYVLRTHSTYGEVYADQPMPALSTSRSSSLGDIRLIGSYQGFLPAHNFGVQFGVKLPTGRYGTDVNFNGGPKQGTPLDASLQPGTGSTDLIVGAFYFRPISENIDLVLNGQFQSAVKEKLDQPGNDYRPGNSATLSAGLRYEANPAWAPQLQLRHPGGMGVVAQTEAQRFRIPWPIIISRLIHALFDRGLELTVDDDIEILADRPVVIRPQNQVGAAGAGLQARIQGRPRIRPAVEIDGRAIAAGGQLHAQLHSEVAGLEKSLIADDEFDIAQAGTARSAEGGQRLAGIEITVRRMCAHHVWDLEINIPIGIGAVIQIDGEIPIQGVVLQLFAIRHTGGGMSAVAQFILMEVVVFEVQTPARIGRVAHGGVGAQGAAAGGATPGTVRRGRHQQPRDGRAVEGVSHRKIPCVRRGERALTCFESTYPPPVRDASAGGSNQYQALGRSSGRVGAVEMRGRTAKFRHGDGLRRD